MTFAPFEKCSFLRGSGFLLKWETDPTVAVDVSDEGQSLSALLPSSDINKTVH